jgi:hypothetical protein
VSGASIPPRSWKWRVFFTCWLVYSFFWTPFLIREHFPALALVERGTLNVERYVGWTDDIFAGPTGGAFINNNPGASLTGAIPLLAFRPLLREVDGRRWTHPQPVHEDSELFWRALREGRAVYFLLVEFLTVALVMAPVTAGAIALLCARLIQAGIAGMQAAAAALVCGLATPILYRTAYLNHNLLVTDAGFAALLLIWDPHGRSLTVRNAVLAGLLAGYAVLCDFSGLVVLAVASLYVWLRGGETAGVGRWRLLASYSAAAAPAIAALLLYQAWAFGSFYRPSQDYMAPTAPTVHGYRGFDWPSPSLMWANFFDPRFGLFAYCPALLLAFAALFLKRVPYRVPRREMWILLMYFAAFVLFCGANRYSWLQPLTGFRYLVPIVPALALLAIQAAQALPRKVRWLILLATAAQSFVMAAAHENNLADSVSTFWRRRGALLWMIRLREAGLTVGPIFWLAAWAGIAVLSALIWRSVTKPATVADVSRA